MLMLGTYINVGGILLGGILGYALRRQFAPTIQVALKGLLGILVVFTGLAVCWQGLSGGPGTVSHFFKFLLIAVLAMMLGKLTGKLLRLQKGLNKLGQFAGQKVAAAADGKRVPWHDAFTACAILFCLPPMAVFGAMLDGLNGHWQTLAIKAVMDALATMAFVSIFGSAAIVAAIPVFAFQGTITLAVRILALPHLSPPMIDALLATLGLLIFSVSLIILDLKKVELADYLPSLAFAPMLAWVWR